MTRLQFPTESLETYRTALTIAGSDSGGGAGIQADLKTFSALGCYGMSAITALTAQNTIGVFGIHPVPPAFVAEQLDAVFSDIAVDAIKIGMLFSAELIHVVADRLRRHDASPVVLDPVMVAQSGDKLLQDDAVDAIRTVLMPLADVVTPNLPEAAVLLDRPVVTRADMRQAAKEIANMGARSVLIKAGHLEADDRTDLFYTRDGDRYLELPGVFIHTRNNHGTGCTLSSAVAAFMACGASSEDAVRQAKTYITEAIRSGAHFRLGKGHGPVDHFHGFRK